MGGTDDIGDDRRKESDEKHGRPGCESSVCDLLIFEDL